MQVDVAVNIVTFNSARFIRDCLDSVQAQQEVRFSVCVVDNASTDDTVARVSQAQAGGLPLDVLTLNSRNVGYAAAHNQALDATKSRYVLTLNPDTWLEPYFLRCLVSELDAYPDVGSASGKLLRVENLHSPPVCVDSNGLFMRRNRRQGLIAAGQPISSRSESQSPTLIWGTDGSAAFYRRAMLEDIRIDDEVFDSSFFMHKEDIDVCWRAALRGWKSLYVPSATAYHVRTFRPGHRSTVAPSLRCYAVRNRYLLMLKNDHVLLSDVPSILIYELMILGYLLLHEQSSLRAYVDVLPMLASTLAKRRAIQSGRRVDKHFMQQWFSQV
jgi:GT2 family glycosyltransferase